MREDPWRRIADRIESTWPGEPGAGRRYREELGDLDPRAVDAALDELLIEYRNAAPPPAAVRDAVAALPPEDVPGDGGVWDEHEPAGEWGDERPGQPPAPAGPPPPATRPVAAPAGESRRATVALILGAAGFVTVPVLVSVAAIIVANQALREIAANPGLGGEQRARVGRMLGWIELTVMALTVVIAVLVAVRD